MKLITIDDCFKTYDLYKSMLSLSNKVNFNYKLGYVKGFDKQTYWDFASSLDKNLKLLTKSIKFNDFKFDPTVLKIRRIKYKERKIYISTWRDKVVERFLNASLTKLLSPWYSQNSYAYRTGVGIDKCQHNIIKSLKNNYKFICKKDISNYFYSIDKSILIEKLKSLIKDDDFLFELLVDRINFKYFHNDEIHQSDIGIPFGSPLACCLANIYLTETDKIVSSFPVVYYRYADDFLILGNDEQNVISANNELSNQFNLLKLHSKPSHTEELTFNDHSEHFKPINSFKYLGIKFDKNGVVSLSVEKQRKIINLFKRNVNVKKALSINDLDERLRFVIDSVNGTIDNRIRGAAIIDYYLKHINNDNQLKQMDMLIAQFVISVVLNRKFKYKLFSFVSYSKLRDFGLVSLVHRRRLHHHGHLKVNFLELRNNLLSKRYFNAIDNRINKRNSYKIAMNLKRINDAVDAS